MTLTIVGTLVVLGVIMTVHELGHLLLARWARMKVHEFSFGIGPALGSVLWKDIRWSVRPFPFFAFVRIAGMEPGELDEPDGFNTKPAPHRLAVLFAGSFMNFVTAIVLFCILGMRYGEITGSISVIQTVLEGPAARVGLRAGDRIIAVDGIRTTNVPTIQDLIETRARKLVRITVVRRGVTEVFELTPYPQPAWMEQKDGSFKKGEIGRIGIVFTPTYTRLGALDSVRYGFRYTLAETVKVLWSLKMKLTGRLPGMPFGGPVMIAHEAGQEARMGLYSYVSFVAVLNTNVGLINLFPIPALDGARIFLLLFAMIRRRSLDPKKELALHALGFALLILLAVLITFKDIRELIHLNRVR